MERESGRKAKKWSGVNHIGTEGHGQAFGLSYKWGGKPGLCDRFITFNSELWHCRKLRAQ